jgi:pyruvate dehydrogenase E1 component alpha subunit
MLLIRRFEEKAGQLYGLGLIGGFCHLYIGQEAVAVGPAVRADEGKDSVITGYRDHGHMLAYGIDPKVIMAELTGRAAGISKGKGGSMHMFSVEHASTAGTASSARRCRWARGWPSPTSTARTAAVHGLFRRRRGQPGPGLRKLQHGRLWKLPIVFVIENNQYAMGTASSAARPRPSSTAAAPRSAFPAWRSTAWTCWKCAAPPKSRWNVRGGNGPVLMELNTYRYRGHSMSDPAKYRSREEVQEMREKHDPIERAKAELMKRGVPRTAEGHRQAIRAASGRSRRFRREIRPSRSWPNSTPTCWWRATDGHRTEDARAVADHGRGHAGQVAGQGRRRGEGRATSWPRSRPTRRRWNSKRSTKARSARSWCPKAPKG